MVKDDHPWVGQRAIHLPSQRRSHKIGPNS